MKHLKLFCLVLLIAAMLFGCMPAAEESSSASVKPAWPVTVGDITLQSPPYVVSLSSSASLMLCEMGYKDRLIGRNTDCSMEAIADLPAVGTVLTPDLAAIRDLVPDLLITPSALPEETVTFLEQCNIQVLTLPNRADPQALANDFAALAALMEGDTYGSSYGTAVGESYLIRLNLLQTAARSALSGQSFLYISDDGYAAPGDSFISAILVSFGMQNLAGETIGWSMTADDCAAAGFVPDLLLCTQTAYDRLFALPEADVSAEEEEETETEESEEAEETPLFADARFVIVDRTLFTYQSYHMLTSLDALCHELSADYSGYKLPEPEPPAVTEESSAQ